jgi:superfamily II DNA or RNA helicase
MTRLQMIITYNNIWAKLTQAREDEIAEVRRILSYSPPGAKYSAKFKSGHWDGIISLLKRKVFPAGLIPFLKEHYEGEIELQDQRPPFTVPADNPIDLKDVSLRDYQEAAIQAFLKHERGVIKISTRGGKTVCAIAITQSLGVKTLFIVDSTNLLDQAYKAFEERLQRPIGRIGDGMWEPQDITVAVVDSLYNGVINNDPEIMDFLQSREFVTFDECHQCSDQVQRVSAAMPNARWRLGLSATAMMTTKENMLYTMALAGPIVYEIAMETLVDNDQIAQPYVYFIDVPEKVKIKQWIKWHSIHDCGIVNHPQRNLMIALSAMKTVRQKKTVLILVEKKDHGLILEEMLKPKCNVRFVSGKDKTDVRINSLKDLEDGKLDVLITTKIFNMGQDIPFLDCVIVAAGGKSPISLYQSFGRAITKTDTKDRAFIVDFIDHSHPKLLEHSEQRVAIAERQNAFIVRRIRYDEFLAA